MKKKGLSEAVGREISQVHVSKPQLGVKDQFIVRANGPDDGAGSWQAMQDGAHFIELVPKRRGARRSVLLQSDGEGTDEDQAMAYVVRAVNGYGSSKTLLDVVARLAEAVPLGKVRRATSKEIEQTGAAVDAVLAAYRQVRTSQWREEARARYRDTPPQAREPTARAGQVLDDRTVAAAAGQPAVGEHAEVGGAAVGRGPAGRRARSAHGGRRVTPRKSRKVPR